MSKSGRDCPLSPWSNRNQGGSDPGVASGRVFGALPGPWRTSLDGCQCAPAAGAGRWHLARACTRHNCESDHLRERGFTCRPLL